MGQQWNSSATGYSRHLLVWPQWWMMVRRPVGMQWWHLLKFRDLLFLAVSDLKSLRVKSCGLPRGPGMAKEVMSLSCQFGIFLDRKCHAGNSLKWVPLVKKWCNFLLWAAWASILFPLSLIWAWIVTGKSYGVQSYPLACTVKCGKWCPAHFHCPLYLQWLSLRDSVIPLIRAYQC